MFRVSLSRDAHLGERMGFLMNWLPLGTATEPIRTGQKVELGIDDRNGAFVRVARDENGKVPEMLDDSLSSDRFIRVRALEAIGKDCEIIVDKIKKTAQRSATTIAAHVKEVVQQELKIVAQDAPPPVPQPLKPIPEINQTSDIVNHPPHYTSHPSGVECIQVTEHMNFCLGNTIKYLWRADSKGATIEDLKKAKWYLEREIKRQEKKG